MATTPFLSWGPLERLPCLSHSVWPQPHPFCSSGSCVPFCFPSASQVFISPGHTPHRGENGVTTLGGTGRESKRKEGEGKGRGERKGTLSLPGLIPHTELWELNPHPGPPSWCREGPTCAAAMSPISGSSTSGLSLLPGCEMTSLNAHLFWLQPLHLGSQVSYLL